MAYDTKPVTTSKIKENRYNTTKANVASATEYILIVFYICKENQ